MPGSDRKRPDRTSPSPTRGGARDRPMRSDPNAYVVGVDYGTLSGRALVVRISDGAECGTAVWDYRHGVIDSVLPATGEPLPPDWALQDPQDYCDVLREAVPAAVARAGIDPASGRSASAPTSLPARCCRRWPTAPRCARYRAWKAGRTLTPSCGSTTPPRLRPTGSTSWRIAPARTGSRATAARSPLSGSSPRRCSCWRKTRRSTSARIAGSRPRTGSSGSSAGSRPGTPARPATRASSRTGAIRRPSSWPSSIPGSPSFPADKLGQQIMPLGAGPAR